MVDDAIARTEEMLRLHLLLPEERYVDGRIGIGPNYRESSQQHARSLDLVLSLLLGLRDRLDRPVPDRWHTNDLGGGARLEDSDPDPLRRALLRYFLQYAADRSTVFSAADEQHLGVVFGGWTNRAHLLGIYVWVPDPTKPEKVLRLEPTLGPSGPVLGLWRDEQGRLFYLFHGHRAYIVDSEGQFPSAVSRAPAR